MECEYTRVWLNRLPRTAAKPRERSQTMRIRHSRSGRKRASRSCFSVERNLLCSTNPSLLGPTHGRGVESLACRHCLGCCSCCLPGTWHTADDSTATATAVYLAYWCWFYRCCCSCCHRCCCCYYRSCHYRWCYCGCCCCRRCYFYRCFCCYYYRCFGCMPGKVFKPTRAAPASAAAVFIQLVLPSPIAFRSAYT